MNTVELSAAIKRTCELIRAAPRTGPAPLVGVSGIDGSGKGYVSAHMVEALEQRGHRVALIHLDDWLATPESMPPADETSAQREPGTAFYEHGVRFAELFSHLVDPLVASRGIDLRARYVRPDRSRGIRQFTFARVDVVILEGIFIFRREYRSRFDLRVWIECSFETALERAVERNQEGLSPDRIRDDYATIYFPAQRVHARLDQPRAHAHASIVNDPRLEPRVIARRAPAGDAARGPATG
ncbi:MAG: uridine kinase [Phycisphaerales bacterium]